MAYGSAEITATEIALAAADKPMILARNWLRLSAAAGRWVQGGTWAADTPATGFESLYAYDDYSDVITKPNAANAQWYYVVNLGSGIGEIDGIAIMGHNFGTVSAQCIVEFCTDQDGLFTPVQQAHTFAAPSTDKRLVSVDLRHAGAVALRYSEVQYLRLNITSGGAITPEIGELIISRRRQLKHEAKLPYDQRRLRSKVASFEADSGINSHFVRHVNRRKFSAMLNPHETAYQDDIVTFFETETYGGTQPWLWVENPNTDSSEAWWMLFDNPELTGPMVGYTERQFALLANEHGPHYLSAGI